MDELSLYESILGLQEPWAVEHVELSKDGVVHVYTEHDRDAETLCPECGCACPRYDTRDKSWRHLDTCQFQTIVHGAVPRAKCPEHGVLQVNVPWAERNSRFTLLFEAMAIQWLKEASINAVSRRLGLSWNATDGIMRRAVARGLSARESVDYQHIAVDEVSSKKGHKYITIVSNESGQVVDVRDDRSKNSLAAFYTSLSERELDSIQTVSMDMSPAYLSATKEHVDGWEQKICFDKFHVAMDLNKAVDSVRKGEMRFVPADQRRPLHLSRFNWLRSEGKLKSHHWDTINSLSKVAKKTARAWAIRQYAMQLWNYSTRGWAQRAWARWYGWAAHSRLTPIKTVAASIKKNLWGIINAIVHRKSNAGAESINSRIKLLKVRARGFRNKERFKTAILFQLGGLCLIPAHLN